MSTSTEPASREPLADMACWHAYVGAPSGERLRDLLHVSAGRAVELLSLLESEFARTDNWRTAQHLALCYAGRFPAVDRHDLVRASYFAMRAVQLSEGDSHARLALARVHWERRLPLAVQYEVDAVVAALQPQGAAPVQDSVQLQRMLGECAILRGLSFAYLRDVHRAVDEFSRAESAGVLTGEAVIQLLLVNEPDHPTAGDWAATRLLPFTAQVGGRVQALLLRAWRRKLLETLRVQENGQGLQHA